MAVRYGKNAVSGGAVYKIKMQDIITDMMSCMYVVVIIRRRKRLSRCPSRARQQAADAVIGVAKRTYGVVTHV